MKKNKKIIIFASIVIMLVLAIVVLLIYFPLKLKTDTSDTSEVDSQAESQEIESTGSETGQSEAEYNYEDTVFLREDLGEDSIDAMNDQLPYFTNNFAIEFDAETRTYTISLFAILNYEWQYDQYMEDLKLYKLEALEWISQQGVSIYDINIEYIPEEAKDL